MPKITIYENDATGSTYNGDEINVFVPGDCSEVVDAILNLEVNIDTDKSGDKIVSFENDFGKFYITAVTATDITVKTTSAKCNITAEADVEKDVTVGDYKFNIKFGYAAESFTVKQYDIMYPLDENNCITIPVGADISKYLKTGTDNSYNYAKDLLEAGLGVVYFKTDEVLTADSINFLKDYNAYNVEILTMGAPKEIPDAFDDVAAKALLDICGVRKDCVALIDYPTALDQTMINVKQQLKDKLTGNNFLSYGSAFVDWDENNKMPGSHTYLLKLAAANNANKRWDSISGVQRGVVNDIYTASRIKMNKYTLDNDIQTADGISYNGICKVRPYGWTIWGDRTLVINNPGTGLKATSFLSIRFMVCDIAKRAYNASINNTFESNNDVTWTNYKIEIQELLDRMVASGKLAGYKFVRIPTDKKATIACKIRLIPIEPVEDFDIYINLENGSASITEG